MRLRLFSLEEESVGIDLFLEEVMGSETIGFS